MNKMPSGIYLITNTSNGKRYVGQSVRIRDRWRQHRSLLRLGKHPNAHLQRSWDKHGAGSFKFVVLERCAIPELTSAEQRWMDCLCPQFNVAPAAGTNAGLPMHPNTRLALLRANRGRILSSRSKRAIGEANREHNLGRKHSEATRAKMSQKRRGRKRPDVGEKLRGRKRPDHVIQALKAANDVRWEANRQRIRDAIAADPAASTTTISKRIKADWATVRKYQEEFRRCQQ